MCVFINGLNIDYREYLVSDDWIVQKQIIMEMKNNCCEKCGSQNKLQLHHKTYERLGFEKLSDLILLCAKCHKQEHNK